MAHSSKEYMRKYMSGYRKTQCEEDKQKEQWINEAKDVLTESSVELLRKVIQEQVAKGRSLEDAEEFYKGYVSAGMWQEYLDSKGLVANAGWVKGDAELCPKLDTTQLLERSQKLIEMKLARDSERKTDSTPKIKDPWQSLAMKRRKEALAHKAVDVLASVEETVKHSKIQTDQKLRDIARLIEDVKKSDPEGWAKIHDRAGRKDEYAKSTAMDSTVGNLYGKSPDEHGKSPEEIKAMREQKKKDAGHE